MGEHLRVAALRAEGCDWEQVAFAMHKTVEEVRAAVDSKWRRAHRVGYTVAPKPAAVPQPPRRRVVKLQMPPEGRYTAHGLAALPPADRYHRRLDVPPEVQAEHDRWELEAMADRDLTATQLGDPVPSRSALGQQNRERYGDVSLGDP
jgi:hypothetical protein